MPSLRLIAWNCHHGSVAARMKTLARHRPDIVFLQECRPSKDDAGGAAQCIARSTKPSKSIALIAANHDYHLTALDARAAAGRASVAAHVDGPVPFAAIGVWAQQPYAADVLRTVRAYADVAPAGPLVVMGDLNSGTDLRSSSGSSRGHRRIVDALAELGLVSAYHAFHRVEHGHETHATYHHLFKRTQPWHIDFCFVPKEWAERITRVDVVGGRGWRGRSDHRPLMVEISGRDR